MTQFNLLPDIKLEYIKAKRMKRSVILGATAVAGGALAIFILLLMSVALQKQHMGNLTKDIKTDSKKLEGIENLDRILTVQNQLNKIDELHNGKPVASRLKDFIPQITPANVSYSQIELNFTDNKITFTGAADSLKTVNQFVDTLKFTKYKLITDGVEAAEETNAFNNVVLTSFGKDDKGARYQIDLTFDPAIFSSSSDLKLMVPNIITTRSAIEKPSDNLIQPLSNTQSGE